jgi:hypothetical protein
MIDELDFAEESENERKLLKKKSKEFDIPKNEELLLKKKFSDKKNTKGIEENYYFLIRYGKNSVDDAKFCISNDSLDMKYLPDINKYSKIIGLSKNVYFLFTDCEQRVFNAIYKKDFIKYENDMLSSVKLDVRAR